MERLHPLKTYDSKPVVARTHSWLARHRRHVDEQPIATVDEGYATSHFIPRASTLLVKLRHAATMTSPEEVRFVLVVQPAHERTNLTAVRKLFRASSAFVCMPSEVARWTQAAPGCIPPLVRSLGISLVVDSRLASVTEIYASSGRPGFVARFVVSELVSSEAAVFVNMSSSAAAAEKPARSLRIAAAAARAFGERAEVA